ncbi:hypothetical protein [Tsukamurella soli]|uniref:Uncharacterized protein n=1 Tax=Tsukamurella soli TaxID=644556 RepID=A0ABP8JH32_9ACTN
MTEETPQFDGKCAFGVGLMGSGKAPVGDPKHSVVKDGKTYLFSGVVPKLLFELVPGSAGRAEAKWAKRG